MLKKPTKRTMLWTAAGVLTLGIAVPAVSYAADPAPTPSSSSSSAQQPQQRGHDDQKVAEALAKELGIDQQKVADALTKVHEQMGAEHPQTGDKAPQKQSLKDRLAKAVADGKLTQAEADAIAKAADAGVLGGGPGGHRGR